MGLGTPQEGVSNLEAAAAGSIFLNPAGVRQYKDKPTSRQVTTNGDNTKTNPRPGS